MQGTGRSPAWLGEQNPCLQEILPDAPPKVEPKLERGKILGAMLWPRKGLQIPFNAPGAEPILRVS